VKIIKAEFQNQRRGGGTERERVTEWGKRSVRKRKKGKKNARAQNVRSGEGVPTEGTVSKREGARSIEPNEKSGEA